MATDSHALSVTGLTKNYGREKVLSSVSLAVHSGESVALLGPNGAGKTTLLRCLAGLLRPDAGELRVFGRDMYRNEPAVKRMISYVPDTPHFFPELTVWEHLKFVALAHGSGNGFDARAGELLAIYDLKDPHAFPFELSRGMSQKLSLCCALIRPWRLLLLDEPTANLDRQAFEVLKRTLLESKRAGKAIFLSTHQLSLAAEICERFLLLHRGSILFDGDLPMLQQTAGLHPAADLDEVYQTLLEQKVTAS